MRLKQQTISISVLQSYLNEINSFYILRMEKSKIDISILFVYLPDRFFVLIS